jgi:hypothetical protein
MSSRCIVAPKWNFTEAKHPIAPNLDFAALRLDDLDVLPTWARENLNGEATGTP